MHRGDWMDLLRAMGIIAPFVGLGTGAFSLVATTVVGFMRDEQFSHLLFLWTWLVVFLCAMMLVAAGGFLAKGGRGKRRGW